MPLDKGTLQAYLDGELTGEEMQQVRVHLDQCPECRITLEELRTDTGFVRERIDRYEKAHQTMPVNTSLAWERFANGKMANGKMAIGHYGRAFMSDSSSNQSKGWIYMLTKYRKTAIVSSLVIALGISLFFQPVRTLAGQFLSIFRVDKMQTINISPEQLNQLSELFKKNRGSLRIQNFGEITITGEPKTSQITRTEMLQRYPGAILPETLPGGYGIQNIDFNSNHQVQIKLKLANINALLQSMGATRLLPAELDGKTFEIRIPAMIGVQYQVNQKYLELVETSSPELIVPDGVSADELRETLLQLPFLPSELANQLRAINDWQHTLVVPNIEGNAEQVFIGGNAGIYLAKVKNLALLQKFSPEGQSKLNKAKISAITGGVIWEVDGKIYLLCGNVDKTTLLSLAGSIR